MADFWGEKMVVLRVGSRAGWTAVKVDVNWMDRTVAQMAAFWDERMVVIRVGWRADKMAEKTDVKRAG